MAILTTRRCGIGLAVAAVVVSGALTAQEPTFTSRSVLVIRTAAVFDPDGRAVDGLTAEDFVVTENGEPQPLAFVEFQRLSNDPAPAPRLDPEALAPSLLAVTAPGVGLTGLDAADARNRRLLVLYFDLMGMSDADRLRALLGAHTFVSSQTTAADLVAVMAFTGGGVQVTQAFTDDRERLSTVIETMIVGNDRDGDGIPDESIDQGSAFGQNVGEFNFLRTDRQLAALQTAVNMLAPVVGQKTLLHFVSGLTLSGLDNHAQLAATINAATRANVSINPIDARGLVAEAPAGGADVASPAGQAAFTGAAVQIRRDRFERSQDVLHGLARDTGGTAMLNYNDLALGIRRAASAVTSYYVLGYYPTRPERDGRQRRVRITVPRRPTARVVYRESYFAEREYSAFTSVDRERQLEDALMQGDPITQIPVAAAVHYFQMNRSEYFVPVSVRMPGQHLTLEQGRRESRTEIDLIGEVKDERGVTVQNVRDRIRMPLSPDAASQVTDRPVQFEMGFTLLPGAYSVKVLVRDSASGRIGTYLGHFAIPNLFRETRGVRMSSVVLSQQSIDTADALFAVEQRVPNESAHPLVTGRTRTVPSVTRVFSPSRDIRVFFHAYPARDATVSRLLTFVSVYRDDEPVFDSGGIEMDATTDAVPFEFTVPAGSLPPGSYECQVSVLDVGQGKAAFTRVPLIVVP